MRILVLAPTFLPVWGGAERLLYEVFSRLAKRHDIHLLTPQQPLHVLQRHQNTPQMQIPFPVYRYVEKHRWDQMRGRRLHRGFFPPFALSAVGATLKLAGQIKPDVLNVHYAIPTGLAGFVAKWRCEVPLVLSFTGRDVPGPGVPPGWKYYDRLLVRVADEVTYISDYYRTAIYGKVAGTKGVTVGNAASLYPKVICEQAQALRRELEIGEDSLVLFALQRLAPYKGVDVLVRSMEFLNDTPCVLLIAGMGPERERLNELAKAGDLQDRIRFLGFVAEEALPTFWQLADLFVFHSYYETFGMVLVEAMGAGKAVVSVRSTVIPEIVQHGVNGLLVEPGDPEAMAAAIRELINDPERRQAMGKAGKARVSQFYTWDKVVSAYEAVFQGVLGHD